MPGWRELGYSLRGTVTPTDVKDYVYCPVIPWLRRALGLVEPPTPSMEEGARVTADEKLAEAEALGLPGPHRVEVYLRSGVLPLEGVVDLVAGRKRLRVLEVKRVARPARHHLAQLKAYALLVETSMGPVEEAILALKNGGAVRLRVTGETLKEAQSLVEAALEAVYSDEPPTASQPEAKCRYCFYRSLCPVRP